jgi:hypothetical protein
VCGYTLHMVLQVQTSTEMRYGKPFAVIWTCSR